MSTVLDATLLLRDLAEVDALDLQLAALLVRRGTTPDDAGIAVALGTLLVSRALREGHSAITLTDLATQATELHGGASHDMLGALPLHDAAWWNTSLESSSLVGNGQLVTPLVLRDGMLQLHRYFAAEQRIAERIRALLQLPAQDGVAGFSIVTGGPGTGKTTRVARQLLELTAARPELRVALAAPTGKAAARLTESIRLRIAAMRTASSDLPLFSAPPAEDSLLELEARTLHRLLRYHAGSDTFRANAANPLRYDLVIVDEASMVDVLLLDAVLQALKPGARLMLVGDQHQLSSVEAGDVLGVLCRAAESAAPGSALSDAVTRLTYSHRFAARPAIGQLASAILAQDAADALVACGDGAGNGDRGDEVRLRAPATGVAMLEPVTSHLDQCLAASSASALLDALDSFRLLAPEREGRSGVNALNAAVERWLVRHGRSVSDTWYHGRPVLVTANDYTTRVFNGDIGVVWKSDGRTTVHFRHLDGTTRAIAPGRLPSVETAWAMTVHKAQGSEFDDVVVVLPTDESRVMSRELLYTAVTRARRSVTIVAHESAVRAAIAQGTTRTSGLESRLRP